MTDELVIVLKIALVIVGWGGWLVLLNRGTSYIRNYLLASTYLFSLVILTVVLFREGSVEVFSTPSAGAYLLLLPLFLFNVFAYFVAHRFLQRPEVFIRDNPREFNIPMDYRYLLSKSFEILFQQIVIALLTNFLIGFGWTLAGVILLFAILFGFMHMPGLRLLGKFFGTYYLIAGVVAGIVFPIALVSFRDGFVYNYIIHWLFYILSGIAFWIWHSDSRRQMVA